MPSNVPTTFHELMSQCRHTAVHLEMRDSYAVDYEKGPFAEWRQGFRHDPSDRASWWRPWLDLVEETVSRGVTVRRARIVSEPVSEYTRFLFDGTFTNIAAGEQVRWLPRRQASAIALPGNDFWLFDDRFVRWNHFTGEGASAGPEDTEDPAAVKLCATAFEAVWARATPHDQYRIH
ncbi:hypothetical protein E2C00_06040 [Streptomyces sp. WAC05374]|uniref:DUF6879 family protein n=1 Tax=Streptomyces sp. WAC05374 TaxID=2487420 RepID=UPI000F892C59|nr:DUF6879 family protein [Streptomyces sp. WAC05374]RST06364.1 hypothetical protein EF905_32365 [Streptomyces sp. WAC05374]TDF44258.1 hypothetical protein E2B92_16205 [Streptomyces sp. WAC05374]TDF53812.1 hypothetical protein E2C02_18690 [Streptomyces sp. WAC05374]TDF58644.1 hypothetical protein E2C00_06040 [Streptomyces sp. WAC05374]